MIYQNFDIERVISYHMPSSAAVLSSGGFQHLPLLHVNFSGVVCVCREPPPTNQALGPSFRLN